MMSMLNGAKLVEAIEKILAENPKGLTTGDLDNEVVNLLNIDSDTLQEKLRDGKRSKFKYRMAWARVSAKKSRGLVKRGNLWLIP